MRDDTIAALATPAAGGALAIVRVSGVQAESILASLFAPRHPITAFSSHHLYYGDIVNPQTGEVIDEVLACIMRSPRSFTGEDVVEIYCHGGVHIPHRILSLIIEAGARPAERGEFTRRAFLHGRMDLTQAEAVAAMIGAMGDRGREVALRHLRGELKRFIEGCIARLNDSLARLEASIDFTDHVEEEVTEDITRQVKDIRDELRRLAQTYRHGRLIREGASTVIIGKPNVGKSSLLNCLLGRKRAIVTSVPGTTRDFLEELLDIDGIITRIVDTAGVHTTDDILEREGIDLVWERLAEADLVLFICDGSNELDEDDRTIMARLAEKRVIPVINKIDLPVVIGDQDLAPFSLPPVRISAKFATGIEELTRVMAKELRGEGDEIEGVMITQLRHRHSLDRAIEALECCMALDLRHEPEIAVEEIREAVHALGEIIGDTTPPDVLDMIFSSFCVGK